LWGKNGVCLETTLFFLVLSPQKKMQELKKVLL